MQYALAGLSLVAAAMAQGVPNPLYPPGVNGPPTQGTNFPNNAFILGSVPYSDPTDYSQVYNCTKVQSPRIALVGSALIDEMGETGEIVANYQFQFDGPPQAGVLVSAGWVRGSNARLSLAGNDKFFTCGSGGFSNLYNQTIGDQCTPAAFVLQLCSFDSKGNVNYQAVKKPGTSQFQIPQSSNVDTLQDNPGLANPGKPLSGSYPSGSASASVSTPTSSSASASSSSAPASSASASSTAAATTTSAAVVSSMPSPPATLPSMQYPPVAASAPAAAAATPSAAPASNGTVSASAAPSKTSPAQFTNAAAPVAIAGGKVGAVLAVVAGAFALA